MDLAIFLKERGISQRWLAGQLGRHESVVSNYCKGLVPAPDLQQRIAEILDTTPETLGWPGEKEAAK